MLKRKLILVFSLFFVLSGLTTLKGQQNNVAIVLNEYSASNLTGGVVDNYGNHKQFEK